MSNELGASNPQAARLAVTVVLVMAVTEGVLVGAVLILIRNIWGYAYSNEVEVVRYVAAMMPILAISNFMDGLQSVLSGLLIIYLSFVKLFSKTDYKPIPYSVHENGMKVIPSTQHNP